MSKPRTARSGGVISKCSATHSCRHHAALLIRFSNRIVRIQGAERPVEWNELERFGALPLWVVFTDGGDDSEPITRTHVLEIEEMQEGTATWKLADVKANSPGAVYPSNGAPLKRLLSVAMATPPRGTAYHNFLIAWNGDSIHSSAVECLQVSHLYFQTICWQAHAHA